VLDADFDPDVDAELDPLLVRDPASFVLSERASRAGAASRKTVPSIVASRPAAKSWTPTTASHPVRRPSKVPAAVRICIVERLVVMIACTSL
jgi:hypothetical protein